MSKTLNVVVAVGDHSFVEDIVANSIAASIDVWFIHLRRDSSRDTINMLRQKKRRLFEEHCRKVSYKFRNANDDDNLSVSNVLQAFLPTRCCQEPLLPGPRGCPVCTCFLTHLLEIHLRVVTDRHTIKICHFVDLSVLSVLSGVGSHGCT